MKIFVCPNCLNVRTLKNCKCQMDIKNEFNIYNFIDWNIKSDFDYVTDYYLKVNKIQEELARKIKENLDVQIILDVGCGEGDLSLELGKLGFDVISIDIAKSGLVYLSDEAKDLDNVYVVRADAYNIPLIDNSVDLVIANNLFHLLISPERVLEEIHRVLKKGGYFIQISESAKSYFLENGNTYKKIKELYNKNYWLIVRELGYKQKQYNEDFNIFLSIGNLFKYKTRLETNPVRYFGILNVERYLLRERNRTDYAKFDIPYDVHRKVHKELVEIIEKEFGEGNKDISLNYEGETINIIDVYQKED